MDRVAAAALTGHTQNKHIRVPLMSFVLTDLQLSYERYKGRGFEESVTYVPEGGDIATDSVVLKRRMGVPYDFNVELSAYTSNLDHQFQIIEQITTLFDPNLQIQSSDSIADMAKISTVTLNGISLNNQGIDTSNSRTTIVNFTFTIHAYLTMPAEVRRGVVNKIITRIQAISDPNIGTVHGNEYDNKSLSALFDERNVEQVVLADVEDVFD
jgi:hypothetical protein